MGKENKEIKLAKLENEYFQKTGKRQPLQALLFMDFDAEFQIKSLEFALKNNALIDVEYDMRALDKVDYVVFKKNGEVIKRIRV